MGVKTYQAYSMAESLSAAKRDLGPDAVILETRTFKRGGLLGIGRRTICELTASTADRAELSGATPPPRPRSQRAASTRSAGTAAQVAYAGAAGDDEPDLARTQRLAREMLAEHERAQPAARPKGADNSHALAGLAGPKHGTKPLAPLEPRAPKVETGTVIRAPGPATALAPHAPVARRFILRSPDRTPAAPEPVAMHSELSAIKTMVGQVLHRQGSPRQTVPPDMPQNLFDMYLEMIGQELSEELADRIVAAARDEIQQDQWADEALVRDTLLRHLAELVPAADEALPTRSPDERPLTIALIGPTGVGKTTTLAKLAASFKLREQRRVGLVTCDTYRIAAVDQLRTYANIIGLPLEVALTPAEMRRAVHALRECDVILIDTAGRGPNDRGRLEELHDCLSAADPHEVHLVLSSTASQRVLLREAEAFAALGADRLVLTKLDEAVSFGVLVNVMQSVGKKLSFITTGQEVPDHLEVGRPRRLAELVLGAPLHA
jgi:flagellar biosynthesis protein FlhF